MPREREKWQAMAGCLRNWNRREDHATAYDGQRRMTTKTGPHGQQGAVAALWSIRSGLTAGLFVDTGEASRFLARAKTRFHQATPSISALWLRRPAPGFRLTSAISYGVWARALSLLDIARSGRRGGSRGRYPIASSRDRQAGEPMGEPAAAGRDGMERQKGPFGPVTPCAVRFAESLPPSDMLVVLRMPLGSNRTAYFKKRRMTHTICAGRFGVATIPSCW